MIFFLNSKRKKENLQCPQVALMVFSWISTLTKPNRSLFSIATREPLVTEANYVWNYKCAVFLCCLLTPGCTFALFQLADLKHHLNRDCCVCVWIPQWNSLVQHSFSYNITYAHLTLLRKLKVVKYFVYNSARNNVLLQERLFIFFFFHLNLWRYKLQYKSWEKKSLSLKIFQFMCKFYDGLSFSS